MKLCQPLIQLALLLGLTTSVGGQVAVQSSESPSKDAPQAFTSGVVVEEIAKYSEAEKAGLKEGDIILHWARGEASGEVQSPFDLSSLEIEQAPRGVVIAAGFRGKEKQDWSLGPSDWGIKARPNFPEPMLTVYRQGQELAKAGKPLETAESWRSLAGQVSGSPSVWLLYHSAAVVSEARQWKEADSVYQEALGKAAGMGPGIPAALVRAWARTFDQRSDWANAEKYYQQAIAETQKLGRDSLMVAMNIDSLGEMARKRGDLSRAETYHHQSLDIRRKLAPGSLAVADSFNNLGVVAWNRGDLAKAEEYYGQALEIRQKLAPASLALAGSFQNLGNDAFQRGDLAKAEEYYLQALEIKRKLAPGSLNVASTFNNLGAVASTRGDLVKAEEYHHQALEIRQKLAPGSLDAASTFSNLGMVAHDRGDLAKAEEYHRQALDIQNKLAPGSLEVSTSLINFAGLAMDRGDLAKAEAYLHQSLDIKQKLAPGSLDAAVTLINLGSVVRFQGDLAKAEKYILQALEIFKKVAPDSLHVAGGLNNLGVVAGDRGDLAKAEEYYAQAKAITEKVAPGSLYLASSFNNLGEIAGDRGDPAKAEEYHRQALIIQQKLAPDSLYVAAGFSYLGNLARDRGDLGKAEEYYHQALAIREELAPGSSDHATTLAALASVMRRKQEPDAAAQLFAKALDALENQASLLGGGEETRSNFRAERTGYYKDYADLLISQKQPERAWEVLERWRSRSLLEMLAAAHIDIHKGVDPALLEREHSLSADLQAKSNRRIRLLSGQHSDEQLASVDKEINDLVAQYQEVQGQIRTSSPGYAALTQPQLLTAKQVQQRLLDDDTLLLEYSLGEERSYVFAVTPDSLAAYELPKRAEIEHAARPVYDILTARNQNRKGETEAQRIVRWSTIEARYPEAAGALSRMILGPVASLLEKKRLLIVSDGVLQYLPVAALPSPGDQTMSMPLVASHEIVSLPSASVLALLRQESAGRAKPGKAVAVLADPVFDVNDARVRNGKKEPARTTATPNRGELDTAVPSAIASPSEAPFLRSAMEIGAVDRGVGFARLFFTRHEADAILKETPPGQGMEALDFQASLATATSPDLAGYRIVHFATHGLLNSEHPELSGLVLSLVDQHGKAQNGFLQLEDIYNLNLPVDMVVLSACETGLGKEIKGEGLVGLTRGFMYAGATRVVASLWKVGDAATAELMGRFYKGMLKDGLQPAAALQKAQVEMRKQKRWSAPYHWAGFVMQGEW